MNNDHILIKGISKVFPDGTKVLQPIDLQVEEGEVLVLLGPSGCGKSTLLRIIAGLEKATEGTIFFHEEEIIHLPPEKRDIGFVFQQYALFPTMTVAENIAFGIKLRKKSRTEQEQKVEELLELMNIKELRDRRPSQLSGGQQQRVAVARALAIEPKVLLMDEPLTALDAKLKDHLRMELAQLFRKLKITTIYVTHDQTEAMAIADRIAVMKKGVVEQVGTPQEIYRHPRSSFVAQFVGQINRLHGKIRSNSIDHWIDFGFHQVPYRGECSTGAELEAFIRPEDICIGNKNSFHALVNEVIFLGERFRLLVDCQGQKLIVDIPNDVLINQGDQIQLQIDENKLIFT
ncbi:ABC transporter ATP-binding protein [Aneurinibacillus terranovensis]|uniref:ABC transporter ATP-binding protein n=1 Tax=Aneurinibacillus terranovensis TaxID=278991 RepID=UPI0004136196|nr:ABC transporter ATP-binding protein [Aneurinibacillus terranovensis]